MDDELKDILSNGKKDNEQDKLLQYLQKKLPGSEAYELEKQMNEDPFLNDAIEGLQEMSDTKDIPSLVQDLNAALKKQLEKKKSRKEKRKWKQQPFTYYSIVILLVLIVIAYVVIKKIT
jgi:hypothetical protein